MKTSNLPTPPHLIQCEFGNLPYTNDLSEMNNCPPAHLLVAEDYMLPEDEEEEERETVSIAESGAGSDEDDITSVEGSNSARLHTSTDSMRDSTSRERCEREHYASDKSHHSIRKSMTNEVKTLKEPNSSKSSPISHSKKNDMELSSKFDQKKIKKERNKWLNIFRRSRRAKVSTNGKSEAENETSNELVSETYPLSDESSSDDSKGHNREMSTLSTTPFASLQDDIAACLFQAGITENIKARAFLEKERQQEESYKKEKEAQEQRMRSSMNTTMEEETNGNKNDNRKVDWIKIVGNGTADTDLSPRIHIFSKEPVRQTHDDLFVPRMVRFQSSSSHIDSKESLRQSHCDQLIPRMVRSQSTSSFSSSSPVSCIKTDFQEHCSTDCNSEEKNAPREVNKSNKSIHEKPQTSDETSDENADKLSELVTIKQINAEGLTVHNAHTQAVELLNGKHKRYGSLIKSRNLLKRFGSFNQEEKEFIKQVFEFEHETSLRDLFQPSQNSS